MSDEFVQIPEPGVPDANDRPLRTSRRSVRLFLLGDPDDVEATIAELHTKQFGEVGLWSKPLSFPELKISSPSIQAKSCESTNSI